VKVSEGPIAPSVVATTDSQVWADAQRKALDAQLDELFGTSADDLEAAPAPRSKIT
jgi:hypothetical protein